MQVVLDTFTRKSKGFGFLSFGSPDEAERALNAMHGKELLGRPVCVCVRALIAVRVCGRECVLCVTRGHRSAASKQLPSASSCVRTTLPPVFCSCSVHAPAQAGKLGPLLPSLLPSLLPPVLTASFVPSALFVRVAFVCMRACVCACVDACVDACACIARRARVPVFGAACVPRSVPSSDRG